MQLREGTVQLQGHEAWGKLLEHAWDLASVAHQGQLDKSGQPYIAHPMRVAARMRPNDITGMIVALLHDTLEDSAGIVTIDSLREAFPPHIVEAVDAISRAPGERYWDYIERCKQNPIARSVKMADLRDNMDHRRRFKGDEGLRQRYLKTVDRLKGWTPPVKRARR